LLISSSLILTSCKNIISYDHNICKYKENIPLYFTLLSSDGKRKIANIPTPVKIKEVKINKKFQKIFMKISFLKR
jgi:hypothetical protein